MRLHTVFAAIILLSSGGVMAEEKKILPLKVTVDGITSQKPIPNSFAYCVPDGKGRTKDGGNISPAISWSAVPAGTKSFAVIMVDPDVPSVFDDANKEGKQLPDAMPRKDFYHWVLVDIPATLAKLGKGVESTGGTLPKPAGPMPHGVRGINNFGTGHGGYDGPCPPWNDERLHHYHLKVFALDIPSLGLKGNFGGKEALHAMEGHILAEGEVVGTFTNKPK